MSWTTHVSRYQKGKTNLDFTEARDIEWQWHQLGSMQVCTLLHTGNHTSTPPLCFFTGRMPFLPPNQQCQNTDTTKKCKNGKTKSRKQICSEITVGGIHVVNPEEEKERAAVGRIVAVTTTRL